MKQNSARLRLRSAFRYGYFAFILVLAAVLAGVYAIANGSTLFLQTSILPPSGIVGGLLGLGLSVPLFLLAWLIAGSAMLQMSGSDSERETD